MITPISTLKRRFANFLKPTQEHFWSWMDSYWHKDENIPMNKVEGLSTALEGTASAEQLRNHLTDSQAHSGLFDHKVDKEAGKTLTSNDYTNEEKRTNQVNAQKRVVGLTVTGDVDKIITITFADGTAIQAPFTDNDTLPENLADIKLNSLNFNDQTGVLTGVRSDGQQLTVSLDGRYSLLGHTHPEYALRTHRHNWDDIDGKPALATEGKIQEEIKKIQVGGRNLVRETSNFVLQELPYYLQSNYAGNAVYSTETFMGNKVIKLMYNWQGFQCKTTFEDLPMVISFWAKTTKQNIKFTSTTDTNVEFINGNDLISDGGWHKYVIRKNGRIVTSNGANQGFVEFYCTTTGIHIEEVLVSSFKIEYGDTPTIWSPAPEDDTFIKHGFLISELKTFKNRQTGGYYVNNGGGTGILLSFEGGGSTSSLEFYKSDWYPATRIGVRNTVDGNRFNGDNGDFRDLAWFDDITRQGGWIDVNWTATKNWQNGVIFVKNSCNVELNQLENMSSISFRKVFAGGNMTFTCTGKTIIYTGDNAFNGGDGSTAVASIFENKCYIDIRNI
jgi:hypothetical protein